MNGDLPAVTPQDAMRLLHWELRDLVITAFQYGNAGTESDLRSHLEQGNHLSHAQQTVLAATLNDALIAAHEQVRVAYPL